MEEKQNFPRATGFSGKILIALLFILSGILLFARNMGWITSEVFDLIVSWHSLLILLGIYLVYSLLSLPKLESSFFWRVFIF